MERTLSGIGVLDKSVAVLDAVAAAPDPPGLATLVTVTGLPKATIHRLATGLEAHGWLRRNDAGRYHLGSRIIDLARSASSAWPIADLARPALDGLRDTTGESAQLYVRDGHERVCIVSLESPHELRTIVAQGVRLPLNVGSAGRLLSDESAMIAAGSLSPWLASVEERAPGVASVSAPVRDQAGMIVAAVGISGPVGRLGAEPGERHGAAVAAAARRIEQALTEAGAAPVMER